MTYGALHLLEKHEVATVPKWAFIGLIAIAKPVHYVASLYLRRIRNWFKARRLGARIPPHVKEPWYSAVGLSLIPQMIDSFENGYTLEFAGPWMKEYGNVFEIRLPTEVQLWTVEPEHVKTVLATQFENFEKGAAFIRQGQSLLGTGVFNADGEMWKFHRGITRPFFNRDRISDFDLFDKHTEAALSLAKARLDEGYAVDVQDLVARFTLDTAVKFLFGASIDSLGAGLPYAQTSGIPNPSTFKLHSSNRFVDAFAVGLHDTSLRMVVGEEWPLYEPFKDRVLPNRRILNSIVEPIVEEALRKHAEGKSMQEGEEDTLLRHLVSQTQDKTLITDELLNLLLAGRDTTACTLTYAIYMLAENPHVAQKLRAEILQTVGEKGRPSYEDIYAMKYLRAFINELLRVYPPVPIDVRTANRDTILPNKDGSKPFFVAKGTQVSYSLWDMHRRKDLWGPTADDFDPDRFIDERMRKYVTSNPFIFTPFNAGPRICLGQQFAYNEASFFIVRLMQQFSKFSLATESQPADSLPPASWKECEGIKGREKIRPFVSLTLSVKGGLWARME
ncbi:cytochrome P450 monooxygenase pc-1 [Coprinopsis sp. MPI-PUGE-AT-0042]|nr:cytochrome P450 monooxygenase pc-1 [Coprinopsis sp. MPI-PUGE-AT-0042]